MKEYFLRYRPLFDRHRHFFYCLVVLCFLLLLLSVGDDAEWRIFQKVDKNEEIPAVLLSQVANESETLKLVGGTGNWVQGPCNPDKTCSVNHAFENAITDGENLYVFGRFTSINDITVQYVAEWNGTEWSSMAGGLNNGGEGVAIYKGDFVAGGNFTNAGGVAVDRVARWDGSQWHPLGTGVNGPIRVLETHNDLLVAGGEFTTAGQVKANYIATWNGFQWSSLGNGLNGKVYAIASYQGKIIAGGAFTYANNAGIETRVSHIAQWDGTNWSPLGQGLNADVYGFAIYNDNGVEKLVATGDFTVSGALKPSYIAMWNGYGWETLSGGDDPFEGGLSDKGREVLATSDGHLIAGGGFLKAGDADANRIAMWDGEKWVAMGAGFNNWVECLVEYKGVIIACGWFNHFQEQGPLGIAMWEPTWPPKWYGANKLSCQWHHRSYAINPTIWTPDKGKGYAEDYHMSYFHWGYPPDLPEGTKILIEGEFPHARYFSFHVSPPWDGVHKTWRGGRGAPLIQIIDEDINPDRGHVNPFRSGSDRNARKRNYHITFELRDGDMVSLNPQAAVPPYRARGNTRIGGLRTGGNGEYGPYIEYYLYVPDNYEKFGGVNLPVIHIQRPGEEPVLAPPIQDIYFRDNLEPGEWVIPYKPEENPCLENGRALKDEEQWQLRENFAEIVLADSPRAGLYDPRADSRKLPIGELLQLKDFGVSRFSCTFALPLAEAKITCPAIDLYTYHRGPNELPPGNDTHTNGRDIMTEYFQTFASLKPGEVLIFEGKAPKTPKTSKGSAIAEASPELRHWSLCTYVGSQSSPTVVTTDCLLDEEVEINNVGKFKIVFSTLADKPSNARPECGITWVPWRKAGQRFDWNFTSTANPTWQYALHNVSWPIGDYLLSTYDGSKVKSIMGAYYPTAKYTTKTAIEALGCER